LKKRLNQKTIAQSIQRIEDDIILAKLDNDTKKIKLLEAIKKRLTTLAGKKKKNH
jgi:hypothetical protein